MIFRILKRKKASDRKSLITEQKQRRLGFGTGASELFNEPRLAKVPTYASSTYVACKHATYC
jgi:hypothetical protein